MWDFSASEPVSVTLEGRAPRARGLPSARTDSGWWPPTAPVWNRTTQRRRCVQGEVRRWRVPDGALERYTVTASKSAIQAVAFTPDGKTLFAGEADGSIHPLDAATFQAAGTPFPAQGAPCRACWSARSSAAY